MSFIKMRSNVSKDREVVILEPGRYTIQRPDESPSEAMDRLMNDPNAEEEVPERLRPLFEAANRPAPHFPKVRR